MSNVGFHDVDYHSGEPYDPTDWSSTSSATEVEWASPETFEENQDTNALRWGTMYNFWFEVDFPPGDVVAQLGLFRPGTPNSISALVTAPSQLVTDFVRTDCNDDSMVDVADPIHLLNFLFVMNPPTLLGCRDACDANDDGELDIADPIMILNELFGDAIPIAPFPDCGVDPSNDTLGCAAHQSCP